MMRWWIAIIASCILLHNDRPQAAVGQGSFQFLLLGSGARASAMGEAFTAVSGDAGAPYFNPASAATIDRSELSFMHLSYFADMTMEQFTLLNRTRTLRYGLALYLGRVPDLERRDDYPSQEPLGTFDQHNFTASFFWGLPINDRLSIGNAIKFGYEKLDLESATALALDFGAFYKPRPEIVLGSSLRNFGTRPKFASRSFDLPRELRLGVSYSAPDGSPYDGLLLATDYILTSWGNQSSKINLGGEYGYRDRFFIRAGYNIGYDSRSFAFGGGLSYRNYLFDYAYVPIKNNLGNTHRFTLRIKL